MNRLAHPVHWLLLFGILLPVTGCGGGSEIDKMYANSTSTNVRRLAKVYSMYTKNNDWVGPEDKQTLIDYMKQLSPARLEKMGIDPDDPGATFISERDGEEFQIRWVMRDRLYGPPLPIIFESVGVDGEYVIGFTGNKVQTVGKAEYDRLWKKENFEEGSDETGGRDRRDQ